MLDFGKVNDGSILDDWQVSDLVKELSGRCAGTVEYSRDFISLVLKKIFGGRIDGSRRGFISGCKIIRWLILFECIL